MKKVVRMSPGFAEVLRDTSLPEATRSEIIGEAFKEFDPDMIKFVTVMADRGEIALFRR